jgi:hypothetical protein
MLAIVPYFNFTVLIGRPRPHAMDRWIVGVIGTGALSVVLVLLLLFGH